MPKAREPPSRQPARRGGGRARLGDARPRWNGEEALSNKEVSPDQGTEG